MSRVREKCQETDQHCGSDLLNLVVSKGYSTKMPANTAVKRCFGHHEPGILNHFEQVVNTVSTEEAAQQVEAAQLSLRCITCHLGGEIYPIRVDKQGLLRVRFVQG